MATINESVSENEWIERTFMESAVRVKQEIIYKSEMDTPISQLQILSLFAFSVGECVSVVESRLQDFLVLPVGGK